MRLKKPEFSKVNKRRVTTALVISAVPLLGTGAAFAQGGTVTHGATTTWLTNDWVPITPSIQSLLNSSGSVAPSANTSPTPAPVPVPEPTTSTTSTTAPPVTPKPATPAPATTKTVVGDAVTDMAHGGVGKIQVTITVTGTKITNVTATSPTDDESKSINETAIPKLVAETLKAQSADIAAVSGASYTSPAFKQSLQSAITKAGLK